MNRLITRSMFIVLIVLCGSCSTPEPSPMVRGFPEWLTESNALSNVSSTPEGLAPVLQNPTNALDISMDQLPVRTPIAADLTKQLSEKSGLQSNEPTSFFQSKSPQQSAPQVSVVVNNVETDTQHSVQEPAGMQLSRIEQLYTGLSGATGGRSLRQYGYNQLRRPVKNPVVKESNSAENSEKEPQFLDPGGPVDADYLVGPGDEILLRVTGALALNEKRIVQRDGTVFIPEVGAVVLAGIRASELDHKLLKAIEKQYNPVNVEVTLGRLHAIRVLVLGYAQTPGLYFLPANSTLLDALAVAGGPQKNGSLRGIQLLRSGAEPQYMDLYGLLRNGTNGMNFRLLSGDTVQIPAIGPTAAVIGPMLEGIYEIQPGETLQDLVSYAGGLSPFARQTRVQVERTATDLKREITTVAYAESAAKFVLNDGDAAIFKEAYDRVNSSVSLEGRVVSPGRYPFHEGMNVSALLRYGDGLLVDASFERVLLVRRLGERRSFDVKPGDDAGAVRSELIWIELPALLAGDPKADLSLKRLDRLIVFNEKEVRDEPQVSILGAVRKPGKYRLSSGMRVRDLLLLSANATADAYEGNSMIVRRRRADDRCHLDVELIPFNLPQALQGDASSNLPLQNNDQVVIRRVQALQVRVDIFGRVQFPGTYILPDGSSISDLLQTAGGLLPEADLRAALFSRESVRQESVRQLNDMQRRNQEYFTRVRNQVTRDGYYNESMANQMALQGLGQLGSNAKMVQATGRIVLDLMQDDFPETADDLTLENGDRLVIPRRKNTVAVLGRVFNPNAFICRESKGLRVREYLEMAGGLQEDADKKQFYVLLASGEVRSSAQIGRRKLLRFVPRPGDAILVPQEPLNRSLKSSTLDALMIARQVAEVGMVGATIPTIGGTSSPAVGIESTSTQSSQSTTIEGAYESMLQGTSGGQQ